MEDLDAYYTVEVNSAKGWEVVWISDDIVDAISELYRLKQYSGQYRLTTPILGLEANAHPFGHERDEPYHYDLDR